MSPKTCCWTSELPRLTNLIDVVTLSLAPAHAERGVDQRVGVGRAVIRIVQHVLPERIVGVADGEVAEEAAVGDVGADVEAVVRRQVQLAQREVLRIRDRSGTSSSRSP